MPHTNNANLKASRSVHRSDPRKPKFLQKRLNKKKPTTPLPTDDADAAAETAAVPIVAPPAPPVPRSHHSTIITEFHALEKQIATTTNPVERSLLLSKQEELGGLDAYQLASAHGGDKSRGGESGKWCVKMLKELKVGVGKGKEKEAEKPVPALKIVNGKEIKVYPKVVRDKLRLLDVGAIGGTSFADWPWIQTTCIDLNPQAPHVIRCDFFDFPVPAPESQYDVVGLSLVVNFIGSLSKRSDILRHAHQYLKPTGLLYLVLPLSCLTNSRYLSHARLISILKTTGWKAVKQHDSTKLTYWLLEKDGDGTGDNTVWKKEEVRGGVRRNNFCIIVKGVNGEGEEEVEAEVDRKKVEEDEKMVEEGGEEEEWGGIQEEWGGIQD